VTTKSTPDVFIIESLEFGDEERRRLEGDVLAHVLDLAGRYHKYFYIRTRRELEEVVRLFAESKYRYLHISCHADPDGIHLTLDRLTVAELGILLAPHIKERRVFFSACELGNTTLASALLADSGCYSVVAPGQNIRWGDAALVWAALYHLMFRDEKQDMKRDDLARHLSAVSSLFGVQMRYFSASRSDPRGFREVNLGSDANPSPIRFDDPSTD
jgi:hypothetical protein